MENKSANRIFMPVLLLILAYEWLISSANKMLTKNYYQNLHQQMSQSVSGIQVHSYANLVQKVGLPNYHLFGLLVIVAELFVGLTFVILSIRILQGKANPTVGRVGVIAAIVAAFMSLNYALLGGDTLFIDPANAFQEGISIDWILFLIEVSLAFYFYSIASQRNQVRKNDKKLA